MEWKLSAFADEYEESFEKQCEALNRFGFPSIEIRGVDGKNVSTLTKEEVENVKRILRSQNISVSAIGSPIGKVKLDADLDAHLAMAKRTFETASELGAKNVRVFSFYLPDGKNREECWGQVCDELEKLIALADTYGITLCHENEALIYGESPENCLRLLEHFGGKMKCVFDMGNFVLDGYNPMEAYKLLNGYVEYFHVKDALYAGAIVPAGKGEAQIQEILTLHKLSAKKDAFLTLEPHLQTFSGLNALVGKAFENPYKYENGQVAFEDAVKHLKALL